MAKVSLQIKHPPTVVPQHDFSGAQRGLENLGAVLESRRKEKKADVKEADENEALISYIDEEAGRIFADDPDRVAAIRSIKHPKVKQFAFMQARQEYGQVLQAKSMRRDVQTLSASPRGQRVLERYPWLQDPDQVAQMDPRMIEDVRKELRKEAEKEAEIQDIEQAAVDLLAMQEAFMAALPQSEWDPAMHRLVRDTRLQLESQMNDPGYPTATRKDFEEMRMQMQLARAPREALDEYTKKEIEADRQRFIENIWFDKYSPEQDMAIIGNMVKRNFGEGIRAMFRPGVGGPASTFSSPVEDPNAPASPETPSEAPQATQAPAPTPGPTQPAKSSAAAPGPSEAMPGKTPPRAKTEVRTTPSEAGSLKMEARDAAKGFMDQLGLDYGIKFGDLTKQVFDQGMGGDRGEVEVENFKDLVAKAVLAQLKEDPDSDLEKFVASLGFVADDELRKVIKEYASKH